MRACLSLLIVAGHLVTQVASLHAHAGDVHREHISRPHVHLNWFSNATDAEFDCDHRHETDRTVAFTGASSASPDHDSDAVYIAPSAAGGNAVGQTTCARASTWEFYTVALAREAPSQKVFSDSATVGFQSLADAPVYRCALFLQLQTLRI